MHLCYDVMTIILEYVDDDNELGKINGFRKACLYNRNLHLKKLSSDTIKHIFHDNISKLTPAQMHQIVHNHMSVDVMKPYESIIEFHKFITQKCVDLNMTSQTEYNMVNNVTIYSTLYSTPLTMYTIYEIINFYKLSRCIEHCDTKNSIDMLNFLKKYKNILKEVKSFNNKHCYLTEYIFTLNVSHLNTQSLEIPQITNNIRADIQAKLLKNANIFDQYDGLLINGYKMHVSHDTELDKLHVYISYELLKE
jgi:hypothetical protein